MRMPATFGINQILSHGFGLFLFAALVPSMQTSIQLTHWHLAAFGALSQIAYLSGALLVGVYGHLIASERLLTGAGLLTGGLLIFIATLSDPSLIIIALTLMAGSAAVCWAAIVELISRYGQTHNRSFNLSAASSGTAWGYSINGLLILLLVPLFGWRSVWALAGVISLVIVWWTLSYLKSLKSADISIIKVRAPALSAQQLMRVIFTERTALMACLICLVSGFAAMPFSTWFSSYLAEMNIASEVGSYTWTIIGMTGMVAGILVGKLSDKFGHGLALFAIFASFALSLTLFNRDPEHYALLTGIGYGLMYFPMWGVLAAWVSRSYNSTVTMQINGLCMVTFGLGGAIGNLIAGYIQETQGSLSLMFTLITASGVLLTLMCVAIMVTEPNPTPPSSDITSEPAA